MFEDSLPILLQTTCYLLIDTVFKSENVVYDLFRPPALDSA